MTNATDPFRILFVGDVVGRPGRRAIRELLPSILEGEHPDFVVINSENSAGGFGLNRRSVTALFEAGADVLTNGNHTWDKVEAVELAKEDPRILRPANYPDGAPGRGWGVFESRRGVRVGVLNLLGRVFMNHLEDPFRTGRECLLRMQRDTPVLVVDLHAEATSEKGAFAWHVDGLASAVLGTHTHVPTDDARILPGGTAFQTDVGMTGGYEGVLGMRHEASVERFLTGEPARLEPSSEDLRLDATILEVDPGSGRALSIRRIQKRIREE